MDINRIRQEFQIFRNEPNLAYLDNAAMALKPDRVIKAVDDYYLNYGVNVHRGVYRLSYMATDKYEEARDTIAKFIGAKFEEVVFTRGASSALNLVALSYGMENINEGDEVITTELEHHSSHMPWFNVCKLKKATLKYIPLNEEGRVTVENFKKVLSNKTKVVAINYVSNVMGYITPIREIIKLAHEVGAIVTLDGAQAVPHMKVDVKELDCDFLSFSGHKLCGPTGIGVLYGKYDLLEKMNPIEFGGDMADTVKKDSQTYKLPPYKFETGTPNVAGAIGLAEACKYIDEIGFDFIVKREKELRDKAIKELEKIDDVIIYNKNAETGIISFNINGIHPHDAASVFDNNNVCIRAGHHCAQLITSWLNTIGTIRASFYFYNRDEDIDLFIRAVRDAKDFFGKF